MSTKAMSTLGKVLSLRLREGAMLLLLMLASYLTLALYSYDAQDPSWSYVGPVAKIANSGGKIGAWLADLLFSLLGFFAWLVPLSLIMRAHLVFRGRSRPWQWQPWFLVVRLSGLLLILSAGTALTTLHDNLPNTDLPAHGGGIMGALVVAYCLPIFNVVGSTLILVALLLTGITFYTGLSWFGVIDKAGYIFWQAMVALGRYSRRAIEQAAQYCAAWRQRKAMVTAQRAHQLESVVPPRVLIRTSGHSNRVGDESTVPLPPCHPVPSPQRLTHCPGGLLPAVGLLDKADHTNSGTDSAALEAIARLLEGKLRDFTIDAKVVAIHPGPVITRFEIQPAPGVKASKITNLAKDLARSLAVVSVRVVEVIPGKSVMGIEIPNDNRQVVYFSEVIASAAYEQSTSSLSLALGHDISGQPVVVDLTKMPHLLVAGTTGSGKSVGVNAMLLSLLFKSSPDAVRLIMIDPKMLELSVYEGIPHLLAPVVTDMKKAANALRWCVAEMERRYQLMAALGVRNITGFNHKIKHGQDHGQPVGDPLYQPVSSDDTAPALATLPLIVVVIDEFADMMMIVGKKVEELIARIAQKARAAGIHLILATQRPSVDVITGLIKANVPTRISFQVSSKIDSRTILDQGGAEQLLGHGDMLYLPPGTSVPIRVHGAFVSDDEVHRVVADWKQRGSPDYVEAVVNGMSDTETDNNAFDANLNDDSEQDPLYDEAVAFVTETRRASISSVQRKLKIGYNRAARMIEAMEAAQIVSPMETNGNRSVMAPAPPKL